MIWLRLIFTGIRSTETGNGNIDCHSRQVYQSSPSRWPHSMRPIHQHQTPRQCVTDHLPREIDITFTALSEWQRWAADHPGYARVSFREGLVAHVLKFGLREPITGAMIPPEEITRGGDLREGLAVRGIISRHRAVMRIIEQTVDMGAWPSLRIYAPEAVTAMALRLRSVFPKFWGSEFTLDPERRGAMYPIPFEDLTALTLPSDMFDLVMTNEVLEHVPDIDAALAEMARILKPGAWHIGTHPMVHQEPSIVKSVLKNGRVVHLAEAEYHGDPFSDSGSLVFEIPGWDILRRAKRAGFAEAHFRFFVSQYHGCIASEGVGIFVLCCRK